MESSESEDRKTMTGSVVPSHVAIHTPVVGRCEQEQMRGKGGAAEEGEKIYV